MATKTQSLPLWKSKLSAFRQVLRAGSYPKDLDSWDNNPVTNFLDDFNFLIVGLVITAFMGLAAIYILSYPDQLAGIIGTWLAQLYLKTNVPLSQLLPAFGFAIIVLNGIAIYFITAVLTNGPSSADRLYLIDEKLDLIYKCIRNEEGILVWIPKSQAPAELKDKS